jgi:hypothetical protein
MPGSAHFFRVFWTTWPNRLRVYFFRAEAVIPTGRDEPSREIILLCKPIFGHFKGYDNPPYSSRR